MHHFRWLILGNLLRRESNSLLDNFKKESVFFDRRIRKRENDRGDVLAHKIRIPSLLR